MMNGNKKVFEDHLKKAFQSGYANAATSLSKMTKDKINIDNFHHAVQKLDESCIDVPNLFYRTGENILVTTEVFGEVTGKSYLFLSQNDFDLLTKDLYSHKDQIKEEYIKELDNILSAAVITKLSNELKMKMYGDIPLLIGRVSSSIENLVIDDFNEELEEVYINSVTFSFDDHPNIHPLFIWVIDSNILNVMESKLIFQ